MGGEARTCVLHLVYRFRFTLALIILVLDTEP